VADTPEIVDEGPLPNWQVHWTVEGTAIAPGNTQEEAQSWVEGWLVGKGFDGTMLIGFETEPAPE
jgi:hypothetical protein